MNARVADASPQAKQEATSTAARPTLSPARGLTLHRKCACGGDAGHGTSCESCAAKHPPLQRRGDGGGIGSGIPSSVQQTLSQPGRPLEAGTRSLMESRFGEDFATVRIHDDSVAGQSAHDVHAHAYTVGESIVFAPGQYQPHSESGQHLLAHELAHTVQQKGLQRSGISSLADQGPEYRRLEAEADRAADFAMRGGGTFSHGLHAASRPTLSRTEVAATGDQAAETEVDVDATSSQLGKQSHKVKAVGGFEKSSKTIQAFEVDPLLVPKSKGPNAEKRYQEIAGGALGATIAVSGTTVRETALWQNRPPTANLRNRWLQSVGWAPDKANANWQALGGDKEFPKCGTKTCQIDHIVELQLGGNNSNENMQTLDRTQNVDSGSAVRAHVSALVSQIQKTRALTDGRAKEIQLRFKRVEFKGTEAFPDFEVIDQGANTCLGVEFRARNPSHPSAAAAAATVIREEVSTSLEEMVISAGGQRTALQVPQGFLKDKNAADVFLAEDSVNKNASTLIPGMVLKKLRRNPLEIDAKIDAAPTRVPITLTRSEAAIQLTVAPKPKDGAHALSLPKGKRPNIEFTYPYLSPGSITGIELKPDGGFNWTGEIRSRIPFLPKPLLVKYQDEQLSLGVALNEKTLGKTLPGFKVTKAGIDLILSPQLSAIGSIDYLIGNASKPVASGSVEVKGDSNGLSAGGNINFDVPGLDLFQLAVTYKDGAWAGRATISASQIKIPYVKSGTLIFDIDAEGLKASGEAELELPRKLGTLTLGIKRTDRGFFYSATGRIKVPGLHEVTVRGTHNGTTLEVNAENIGFKWQGFDGKIDKVSYKQSGEGRGTITGTGTVKLNRGAVSGSITVTLHDNGNFSGEGEVNYPLQVRGKKIDAKAKVIVDENQKVRVEGSLKLRDPIQLFDKASNSKDIFTFDRSFPVPSLSIGPLGLQAVIEAKVTAGYYFGPGQLKNVALEAAFNPLAEKIDPSLKFHCDLSIPAGVNIGASIGGGLKLEAGIGRVKGTITIGANLPLDMTVGGPLDVTYANEVFAVNANPGVDAALKLELSLKAYGKAEIGISPISAYIDKTWTLARSEATLGQFSLHAPVAYSSETGFKIPKVDELQWGPTPSIDIPNVVEQLVDNASAGEIETPA